MRLSYFEPALPLLLLIGIVSVVHAWRTSSRLRRPWPQTLTVFGLTLLSLNAGAWIFARPLEIWYSQDPLPRADADVIVVLAGSVDMPQPDRPYPLAGQDTYTRIQRAVWLFKHWKEAPILASGGGKDGDVYASTMRQLLESQGVPPEMVWTESRSQSTHEHALYAAEVLRSRNADSVLLVVEASSMPRAAASFQKYGITVAPAPSRFINLNRDLNDFVPNWRAIALNGETLHEFVGIVWYKLRGWI